MEPVITDKPGHMTLLGGGTTVLQNTFGEEYLYQFNGGGGVAMDQHASCFY